MNTYAAYYVMHGGVDPEGLVTLDRAEDSLVKRGVPKLGTTNGQWSRSKHSDKQIFEEWYRLEQAKAGWWKQLPDCPCDISCLKKKRVCVDVVVNVGGSGGSVTYIYEDQFVEDVCNPDPNVWKDPSTSLHGYHKGAKWCMRSKSKGGHANQCCYDEDGKLITHGSGSGSADYVPGSLWTFFGHKWHDMDPADLAYKLDGYKWGKYSEMYLHVRPQVGSGNCEKNP